MASHELAALLTAEASPDDAPTTAVPSSELVAAASDEHGDEDAADTVRAAAKALYISLGLIRPSGSKADYWEVIGLYPDHKARKQNGQADAHCTLCRKDLAYGATGNLDKHFKRQHKDPLQAGTTMPDFMIDKRQFHWLAIRWIVLSYQSIRVVESEAFRAMIRSANKNIKVPSRQDVVDGLDQLENLARAGILDLVKGNNPAITTDGWSSATGEAYISITLDTIDKKWNKIHLPLECSPMKGSHTAERLLEKV